MTPTVQCVLATLVFFIWLVFFWHKKERCIWTGENPQVLELNQLRGHTVQFGSRMAVVWKCDGIEVWLRYETLFFSFMRFVVTKIVKRRKICL